MPIQKRCGINYIAPRSYGVSPSMLLLLNDVHKLFNDAGKSMPKLFTASNGSVFYATQVSVERSLATMGYKLQYTIEGQTFDDVRDALRVLRKVLKRYPGIVPSEVVEGAGYRTAASGYRAYLYGRMPKIIRLDVASAMAETLDTRLSFTIHPLTKVEQSSTIEVLLDETHQQTEQP